MTTAAAIIRGAMDKLSLRGAGQSVSGTNAAHCLNALNVMVDSWKLSPTFAVSAVETVVAVPPFTPFLTIGSGQDIDIERPVRIELDSFVRVSGIDHPLAILQRDEFNAICQKTLGTSWPVALYYDAGVPTGRVYLWPQAQCELHLVTQGHVAGGRFADLTTNYILPPGYERAFVYSLAEDIGPDFEVDVPLRVTLTAQGLRRDVKRANLSVPQLDVPMGQHGRYTEADFLAGR